MLYPSYFTRVAGSATVFSQSKRTWLPLPLLPPCSRMSNLDATMPTLETLRMRCSTDCRMVSTAVSVASTVFIVWSAVCIGYCSSTVERPTLNRGSPNLNPRCHFKTWPFSFQMITHNPENNLRLPLDKS